MGHLVDSILDFAIGFLNVIFSWSAWLSPFLRPNYSQNTDIHLFLFQTGLLSHPYCGESPNHTAW
jgi:hypothetical protein